jgi:Ubiquitin family
MKLQMLLSDSVKRLKEAISEKQGIDPVVQRLIFGGKQLEDGKALRQYGLGPNMAVHLGESSFGA